MGEKFVFLLLQGTVYTWRFMKRRALFTYCEAYSIVQ